jgi:hypothetical protein
MLSRAIMAPRDLILDTVEAQKIALFFDHILVYGLERETFNAEQQAQFDNDLSYLREQGIALKCGLGIPPIISFQNADGESWSPFDEFSKDCDLVFPFQMGTGVAKEAENEAHADRIVRHYSSQIMYNDTPVVAHATPVNLENNEQGTNSIEFVLKKVPLPPTNLPWEDFVQFRKDEENMAKLRALRIWLQKRSTSEGSARMIQEELEHLLYEYKKYMKIQHKKYSEGVLSTLITSTPEIAGHLITLNFGSALKALFAVRGHSIALTSAELSAPGREVSYIAKAQEFIMQK